MTLPRDASSIPSAPFVRELGPVEWAAVEAVTNGLATAEQGVAQARLELAALRRRRAAVLDAIGLDAEELYRFESDGEDGARVFGSTGGEDGVSGVAGASGGAGRPG
ncbi:MAG: hypothetical protein QF664_14255 [Dehalococcoidia bacterium]|nr:hypothetical protein [Dehalococcoidia bacterium]